MYYSKFFLSLFFSIFFSIAQANEYIKPENISWLTEDIKESLLNKKCKIPKAIYWEYSNTKIPAIGILVGQFASKGQYDLAILCVNGNHNTIQFFWGGAEKCNSELRSWGESIQITNEESMLEHALVYGENKPKEITHDPIEDILFGKSSLVFYCNRGNWEKYDGAD